MNIRKKGKLLACCLVLAIFSCLSLGPAAMAEKKALTFSDFIKIKRLSDPELSPDGRQLAFVVTVMDLEKNKGNSDIWIVPASGGKANSFISSPAADFFPRWSPDGKTLAFISTRSGSPQIWVRSVAEGEDRKLTDFPAGVGSFCWSKSGRYLLVSSAVFPDSPDLETTRQRLEAAEKNQIQARIYDHLLYRHWNSWFDGTRSHLFLFSLDGGKPVDLTPGDYDTPPLALGGNLDFSFSPDEREIAFVRNIDPEFKLALGTNNDIFLTDIGTRAIEKLTVSRANDIDPRYSPDGRYLAYRAMSRPGFEADKLTLILYDRQKKSLNNLTESLDYSL
ncbi:MAG TPA: S9 family peptidase, partial [Candidatus Saccharicenans sp.]|nr:S9 family peptidase [Candidatus Saccharicenans sp.]